MDKEEIINRLKLYCIKNRSVIQHGIIKGVNPKTGAIILECNGGVYQYSLEKLEKTEFYFGENKNVIVDLEMQDCEDKIPKNLKEFMEVFESRDSEKIERLMNSLFKGYEMEEIITIMMQIMANIAAECIQKNINFSADILAQYDIYGKKIT